MRLIKLLTLFLAPMGALSANTDFYPVSPIHQTVDNYLRDDRICAYTKLGPGGSTADATLPSVVGAFGLRRSLGHGAVDLSAQFTGPATFALPRIQYLHYLTPRLPSSAYIGGGVSYGGTFNSHGNFLGLMGETTIGYNFYRNGRVCVFMEANLTQPLIPTRPRTRGTYAPVVSLALGIGL